MSNSRFDPLNELPPEISFTILDYLGPRDLAACSAVNTTWRCSANEDRLWKKFTVPEETSVPPDSPWKQRTLYNRHAVTVNNWLKSKYWEPNLQSGTGYALLANGAILVLWNSKCLEVYDLSDGSMTRRQTLGPPPSPVHSSRQYVVSSNGRHLAIGLENEWCYYEWSDAGSLTYTGYIYLEKSSDGNIRAVPSNQNTSQRILPSSLVHITSRGTAVLKGDNGHTYSFRLNENNRETIVRVWEFSLDYVYSRGDTIYISHSRGIDFFASDSQLRRLVSYEPDTFTRIVPRIEGNDSAILISLKTYTIDTARVRYQAWNSDHSQMCDPFQLNCWKPDCVKLHPTLAALCCLTKTMGVVSINICDIATKTVLWTVRVSHHIGEHHKAMYISEVYLAFIQSKCTTGNRCTCVNAIVDLSNRISFETKMGSESCLELLPINKKCAVSKRNIYKMLMFT